MEQQSKVMLILRWIGFVPGAVISSWLTDLLIFNGNKFFLFMGGINSEGFLAKLFMTAMTSGATGAAFVYAGSLIAPSNRKVVAYVLAMVAVLIAGVLAFPAIVERNGWGIVSSIAMACGVGLVTYQIAEGEIDLDNHHIS